MVDLLQHRRDLLPPAAFSLERRERRVRHAALWVLLPGPAAEGEEVAHEGVAAFAEDAFGVVLHGFEGVLPVSDAHDDARVVGGGGDGEFRGESGVCGAEGVIPRRLDALLDVLEAAPFVMQDPRYFAVHNLPSVATANLDKFK